MTPRGKGGWLFAAANWLGVVLRIISIYLLCLCLYLIFDGKLQSSQLKFYICAAGSGACALAGRKLLQKPGSYRIEIDMSREGKRNNDGRRYRLEISRVNRRDIVDNDAIGGTVPESHGNQIIGRVNLHNAATPNNDPSSATATTAGAERKGDDGKP